MTLSRAQFEAANQQPADSGPRLESRIEDWTDMREWFGADLFNWVRYRIRAFLTPD